MTEDYPLLSVIMPTKNRRQFLEQAIKLFQAQDYPNKELVIVDCSDIPSGDLEEVSPAIRYTWLSTPLTIGMMRNIACSLAQGEIIALMDDDDWYSPQRLSRQAEPILQGHADITGLTMDVVFHVPAWEAWKCSPALHKEIFLSDVHTGTLMFRKSLWGMTCSYPNKRIGEDADFVALLRLQGVRLAKVESKGAFVYIRHEAHNTWPLLPHYHPHMHEWEQVPLEYYLSGDDLAFYRGLRSEVSV